MPRRTLTQEKQHETAVLVMTDIHYGKKTETFNPESCKERLFAVGERIERIKSCLTGYNFDKLVTFMLGDVNDGTMIYATQPHHQAETNVEEQAEQLTDILQEWFLKQQKVWGNIEIECIPGNHGRSGFTHENANWDIVTYKYLQHKLRDYNIPVRTNRKKNAFIRKVEIRKHNYLLYHGHDIKSYANIPWYGIMMRIARWNTTKLAPIDVVVMGHFHTSGTWKFNQIEVMLSGTLITDDDWALQTLGYESANKWWLFGVSDTRPVTWRFELDL